MQPVVATRPASEATVNEDAVALGPGVAVLVDGAGLPASMRRGCRHSVAWYATELATAFRDALSDRAVRPAEALAAALTAVAASHGPGCDLGRGSPSGTVAAWRTSGDRLEHLVLGDATVLLAAVDGVVTVVTDDRLARVVEPVVRAFVDERRDRGLVPSRDEILDARRAALERTRNRSGGFWCAHADHAAAAEALTGSVPRDAVAGVVVASDGATRGYEHLGVHAPDDVVRRSLAGDGATVIGEIRAAERSTTLFTDVAMKPHDDATLVAWRLLP
ncbi:integrase [Xylanimonas protaetiae]|uniref:Integrase n=1 Tax=Xylanimonas protaetiae TaxID=2509457 RepID=A0A4V0YG08_9MICO|nr:integrase [Xylanimonas protaetiae]QAY69561.1 integrase [Xylanimonas protaetiae]